MRKEKSFSETMRMVRKGMMCFQCLRTHLHTLTGRELEKRAPQLGHSVAWACGPRRIPEAGMPELAASFQSDMAVLGFCNRCMSGIRSHVRPEDEITWFTSVRKARAALPLIAVMET